MNKFDRHAVPAFMQDREQFLLWGLINGSKVPLDTRAILAARDSCGTQALVLRPGNANDAHNYVSFDTALELLDYIDDPLAGLGYGFKDDDQVIGMDFDRVLKDGKLRIAWLNEWLAQLDTYVEVSPSGNGLHALLCVSPAVKAELYQRHGARPEFRVGIEKREKDDPHHHVFIGGGFLTLTTHVFAGYSELNDCTGIMETWGKQRAASVKHEAKQARGPRLSDESQGIEERTLDALRLIDPDCDRDTWKDVAAALKDGAEGMALGWDLFHAWSRGDYWEGDAPLKYKGEPATRKVYDSFDGKPGVDGRVRTLATVFALADATRKGGANKDWTQSGQRADRALEEHGDDIDTLARARGVLAQPAYSKVGPIRADEIQADSRRWFLTGMIPYGTPTMEHADGGVGKSTIAYRIMADATHAKPLPYDVRYKEYRSKVSKAMLFAGRAELIDDYKRSGVVWYFTNEADLDKDVVPALIANGGDLSKVRFIRTVAELDAKGGHVKDRAGKPVYRGFSLKDLDQLIMWIVEDRVIPDLLVFDPLSSFIGDIDRNVEGDVRRVLEKLVAFVQRIGAAVLCLMHDSKNAEAQGANRMIGSIAFKNVTRSVLQLVEFTPKLDKQAAWEMSDDTFVALMPDKANHATRNVVYQFRLTHDDPHTMATVVNFMRVQTRVEFMREQAEMKEKQQEAVSESAARTGAKHRILTFCADAVVNATTFEAASKMSLVSAISGTCDVSESYFRDTVRAQYDFERVPNSKLWRVVMVKQ